MGMMLEQWLPDDNVDDARPFTKCYIYRPSRLSDSPEFVTDALPVGKIALGLARSSSIAEHEGSTSRKCRRSSGNASTMTPQIPMLYVTLRHSAPPATCYTC